MTAKEQLLGQIGNYPPEECYSDDNEDDNTINRATDDYDTHAKRMYIHHLVMQIGDFISIPTSKVVIWPQQIQS